MSQKTHLIEPITHNRYTYTVFHLEAKTWLSGIRLSNVGCIASADTRYLSHLGVLALINDIRVYQDDILISRLRDSQNWIGFQQLLKSNRNQRAIQNVLLGSQWGFVRNTVVAGGAATTGTVKTANADNVTTDVDTTFTGVIDLSMISPFLRDNKVLPSRLNKLRVIIDWEQNRNNIFGPAAPTVTDILRPVLIADEVLDQNMINAAMAIKSMPFTAVENEFHVMGANGGAAQTVSKLYKGMTNRYIGRCLLATVPAGRNEQIGQIDSYQMPNESVQVVVNGSEIFPYTIDSPARKLQMTNDAFGQLCTAPLLNINGYADARRDLILKNAETRALATNVSYLGFTINDRIDSFQLVFKRRGGAAAGGNDHNAAELMLMYEIKKGLVFQDGKMPVIAYL